MQVPVEVSFRGCEPSERLRDQIHEKLKGLEERFGGIIAGRVVLKGPSGHHRTGGLYEVGVHLTLPNGRAVDVERTPTPDERFADPLFAINDAFHRARRQLQDEARQMDQQVKHHEPHATGTVVSLDSSGDFGFLGTSDGTEVYFHRNSVLNNGFPRLTVGSTVTFSEEVGEKGPQASTVTLQGKHRMRM